MSDNVMNEVQIMNAQYVLPSNKFERIIYLEKLRKNLDESLSKVQELLGSLKEELTGDESDDTYHLVPVFSTRKTTTIDEEKLKENEELYLKCISVSGSDAVRLIGEDKLKELCIKYAGVMRVLSAGNVTLKQMKKVLTEEEIKEYTTESYKQIDVEVSSK